MCKNLTPIKLIAMKLKLKKFFRNVLLIYVASSWFEEIESTNVNLPANWHWICEGCTDSTNIANLYGSIHMAIHREQRNLYFLFDPTWMDRILDPASQVKVYNIEPTKLDTYIHIPSNKVPNSPDEEQFQIIISNMSSTIWSQAYPGITAIDHFLAQNPCWLPLQEPNELNNSTSSSSNSRKMHNRDNMNSQINIKPIILIRLPVYPFHETCRLFTAIHKVQFPIKCNNSYLVHCLGNIGWGNTFNNVLYYFAESMNKMNTASQQTLVIPSATDWHSKTHTVLLPNNSTVSRKGGWYWAEQSSCTPDIENNDPWSCNFIPISNCSYKSIRYKIPSCPTENVQRSWSTPNTMLDALSININSRKLFNDAPKHSQELWVYTRLTAYLQRPNTRLRSLIRKSLNRHEQYGPHLATSTSTSTLNHMQNKNLKQLNKQSHINNKKSRLNSNLFKPCVTLHIRHGDLFMDGRGRSKIDRSLVNYMKYTNNITKSLGISTIFLASDNGTLVSVAPYLYTNFIWTTQKRPIKYHQHMFDVNNEEDLQVELSHVLAELILATRCSAMVACFDSGFSELIFLAMCAYSRIGRCPPSIDLREPFVLPHLT
eukprot:gene6420-12978_t